MKPELELTRRDFMRAAALVGASAAVGPAGIEGSFETLAQRPGPAYLWVTNPTREPKQVKVTLADDAGDFQSADDVWGDTHIAVTGRQCSMNVPARDAVVAVLR